jgi:hypothetical protein
MHAAHALNGPTHAHAILTRIANDGVGTIGKPESNDRKLILTPRSRKLRSNMPNAVFSECGRPVIKTTMDPLETHEALAKLRRAAWARFRQSASH